MKNFQSYIYKFSIILYLYCFSVRTVIMKDKYLSWQSGSSFRILLCKCCKLYE